MKQVNSLLVVGGGTAGLIAAIILKTKLDIKIDVVHSKNIGIVGVGEGSTEHWKDFMDHAGINQYDLIIIAVTHTQFFTLDYKKLTKNKSVIFDLKGMLNKNQTDARL